MTDIKRSTASIQGVLYASSNVQERGKPEYTHPKSVPFCAEYCGVDAADWLKRCEEGRPVFQWGYRQCNDADGKHFDAELHREVVALVRSALRDEFYKCRSTQMVFRAALRIANSIIVRGPHATFFDPRCELTRVVANADKTH